MGKVHRKFFYEHPEAFDPVIPGKEYIKAYKEFMEERFEILGSKGKASSIQFELMIKSKKYNLVSHPVKSFGVYQKLDASGCRVDAFEL